MTNERSLQTTEIPEFDIMVERNLASYALATIDNDCYQRGFYWYQNAKRECEIALAALAENHGIELSIEIFSTIVAIVSPGRSWKRNIPDAITTVIAYAASSDVNERIAVLSTGRVSRRYGLGAFNRVWSLLDGEYQLDQSKSPKAFAFAHNILFGAGSQYVTIDQHNCHILLGENDIFGSIGISASQYRKLEKPMYHTAELLALPASTFQAIVWQWRQEYIMGLSYDDSSASVPLLQSSPSKRKALAV